MKKNHLTVAFFLLRSSKCELTASELHLPLRRPPQQMLRRWQLLRRQWQLLRHRLQPMLQQWQQQPHPWQQQQRGRFQRQQVQGQLPVRVLLLFCRKRPGQQQQQQQLKRVICSFLKLPNELTKQFPEIVNAENCKDQVKMTRALFYLALHYRSESCISLPTNNYCWLE